MPCQTPQTNATSTIPLRSQMEKAAQTATKKIGAKMKRHLKRWNNAVAVSANHSRQMVAHCAKCSDEKINVLRTPTRLCEQENRQNHQRRADVQDQVAPTVQNPQARLSRDRRRSGNRLRT